VNPSTLAALESVRGLSPDSIRTLCQAPFSNLFLNYTGEVRVCCYNWRFPIGNLLSQSIDEIWNGTAIREIRERLSRFEFAEGCDFCAAQTADGVANGAKMAQFDRFEVSSASPPFPRQIEFSISNACNLECVMCDGNHSSAIRARRERRPPMARVYSDAILDSLRPYLRRLTQAKFLGGEPFLVTEHFRLWDMMIEDSVAPRCHVTTNGTQYNDRIRSYMDRLPFGFAVSLDAATKTTYEAIRVNASFAEVLRNCRRFNDYARERKTSFSFTFCLMRSNWHEFGDFCLMADDWNASVAINTVNKPPSLGVYTMRPEDLRLVLDGLESRAEEFERRLTRNKSVWFGEVQRIRAKVRASEDRRSN
jgi:MoaA/NifB/PqqE/SkfB family radical SAM enzyme